MNPAVEQFLTEFRDNPAYRHILINHLPIIGLAAGALALFIALFLRRVAHIPALIVILVMAASAIPVHWTGEQAYKPVRHLADDAGADWLDVHSDRADTGMPAFYILAGLALVALVVPLKFPVTSIPLSVLVLLGSIACLGVGGWIAQAGGPIMHPELRPAPPPEAGNASLPAAP
jgi:hypothetical protein